MSRWIVALMFGFAAWISIVPFERPIPVGRPADGTPIELEATPTVNCGPAMIDALGDGHGEVSGAAATSTVDVPAHHCRPAARARLGIAAVLVTIGAGLAAIRGRHHEDGEDEEDEGARGDVVARADR